MKMRETRSREVPQAAGASTATQTMRDKAVQVYTTNKDKNKLGREETAAKKALNKLMIQGEVERFSVNVDGVEVEAVIEETESDYIDLDILVGMVDPETFMKIVSATKGAVAEHCGDNVVIACTKTKIKPASLQVRKVPD
jgi:hypothetical protein